MTLGQIESSAFKVLCLSSPCAVLPYGFVSSKLCLCCDRLRTIVLDDECKALLHTKVIDSIYSCKYVMPSMFMPVIQRLCVQQNINHRQKRVRLLLSTATTGRTARGLREAVNYKISQQKLRRHASDSVELWYTGMA